MKKRKLFFLLCSLLIFSGAQFVSAAPPDIGAPAEKRGVVKEQQNPITVFDYSLPAHVDPGLHSITTDVAMRNKSATTSNNAAPTIQSGQPSSCPEVHASNDIPVISFSIKKRAAARESLFNPLE